jgi:hypothetical protein
MPSDPDVGPEGRLLLACARAPLHPAPPPPPAAGPLDPVRLLALAERNGLAALLHRFAGPHLPPDVSEPLAAAAARCARAGLAAAGRLRRLAEALGGRGIRMAAYKGPALAMRAYGDVGLRSYADLDLLVAPDDVPAAAAVLEAEGYLPLHRFPPAAEALFRRVDGDYPFRHPATGEVVELHARVSSLRFGADLATPALLGRARPVRLGGGAVPALADDDLFLALALHGSKHRWARLEWLAAAAALAVRAGLSPERMVERGAAVGGRRTVLLALLLFRDALELALPPRVERALAREPGLAPLAAEARGIWFAAAAPDEPTEANLRFNLRLRDGPAERARFALRWLLVPSPEDWAWVRLPAPLAPLYRLVRPLRLALRYGPGRGR